MDRTASFEIKLEYCPSEAMLADASTSPLQGSTLIRFSESIKNAFIHKNDDIKTRSVLRITDDKMPKPHKECTHTAEHESPSGENR